MSMPYDLKTARGQRGGNAGAKFAQTKNRSWIE